MERPSCRLDTEVALIIPQMDSITQHFTPASAWQPLPLQERNAENSIKKNDTGSAERHEPNAQMPNGLFCTHADRFPKRTASQP